MFDDQLTTMTLFMMETEMDLEISEPLVCKILQTVDAGLCRGIGRPIPGQMCVEAAVCFALGLDHNDDPPCVGTAVRSLKIEVNDDPLWEGTIDRAMHLRKLAVAQLGSNKIDQLEFCKLCLERIPRHYHPFDVMVNRVTSVTGGYVAYSVKEFGIVGRGMRQRDALIKVCDIALEALIRLKSPGCEFLHLCNSEGGESWVS